jgi:hypothetical protein
MASKPLYLFYHIAMIHDFDNIIQDMLQVITESGAFSFLHTFYFSTVGDSKHIPQVIERMKTIEENFSVRVEHLQHDNNCMLFERFTLHKIHEMAQTKDFYFLYLHSKGVTRKGAPVYKKWRDMMLYYTCSYLPICVRMLENGANAVGCVLLQHPAPHFSGNFWWSSSSAISSLPIPIGRAYLDPEMWIGKLPRESLASVYQFPRWNWIYTPPSLWNYQNQFSIVSYTSDQPFSLSISHFSESSSSFGLYGYGTQWHKVTSIPLHTSPKQSFVITEEAFQLSNSNEDSSNISKTTTKMWVFQSILDKKMYAFLQFSYIQWSP